MAIYWAALIGVAIYAEENGNWKKLIVPQDKHKKSCGLDNDADPVNCPNGDCNYANCPYLYFANPVGDPEDVRCVAACPTATGQIVCDCGYCNNGTTWTDSELLVGLYNNPDHFTFNMLPTSKAVLFCLPSGNLSQTANDAMQENQWITTQLTDLYEHWPGVAWGCLVAFFVGFIFLYAVAFLTKPLTYIIITVIMVGSFLLFIVSLIESNRLPEAVMEVIKDVSETLTFINVPDDISASQTWVDFCCILWAVVFTVSFTILVAMRRRLAIAIGVVEEASRALIGMPTLLSVPLGTLFSTIMVSVLFTFPSLLFAVSMRKWDGTGWVYDEATRIMIAMLGFGSIWVFTFIESLQFTAVAGAVCDWYFTPDKSKRQGLCDSTMVLIRSYARILRFHLGSMAFGSLVVAIVKTIRYILQYVSAQIQAQFPGNKVVKILLAVVNCCVMCFERLIKYLTETAYIQIALWGNSFWRSAVDGVKLAVQNLGRLAFVTIMSKCLVLLGKLEIALASAGMTAAYIWTKDQTGKGYSLCDTIDIEWFCKEERAAAAALVEGLDSGGSGSLSVSHSLTVSDTGHTPSLSSFNDAIFRFPTFVGLLCGYFIGSVFMDCFDITIHTIIVCFCEDEKYCDGGDPAEDPNDYPYYAAGSLEEVLGPAVEFGRSKLSTKRQVKQLQMKFQQDIETLRQNDAMDDKERAEAGEGEQDLEAERRKLMEAANSAVEQLQLKEAAELKAVAQKMADKNGKREEMRKKGKGSQRNLDSKAFKDKYGKDLKKAGYDVDKEFKKLDADGSGDLSAEEMKKFAELGKAIGRHDV